jgi:hypothetical protein
MSKIGRGGGENRMGYIYVPNKQVYVYDEQLLRVVLGKVYGYVLSAEYEVCTGYERPALE